MEGRVRTRRRLLGGARWSQPLTLPSQRQRQGAPNHAACALVAPVPEAARTTHAPFTRLKRQ
jgi:hypothetical protein